MVESTTIKITNTVKNKLLKLKVDNEGYSTIIANLLEENKKLKEDVEYLKEEKRNLYKIALSTSDSVALMTNVHKAVYYITSIISDRTLEANEQLVQLEEELSEMLEIDKDSVVTSISIIKDSIKTNLEKVPDVLLEFEKYVNDFES